MALVYGKGRLRCVTVALRLTWPVGVAVFWWMVLRLAWRCWHCGSVGVVASAWKLRMVSLLVEGRWPFAVWRSKKEDEDGSRESNGGWRRRGGVGGVVRCGGVAEALRLRIWWMALAVRWLRWRLLRRRKVSGGCWR